MGIPTLELQAIEIKLQAFCDRVPEHVRDQLLYIYSVKGHEIVLAEKRPAFRSLSEWIESPVAKFKYVASRRVWQLFCRDRNAKWRQYSPLYEAKKFDELLREVEQDPTCIFWG